VDQYGYDHYDPDTPSGSDSSVLGTTIRNVIVLIVASLGVAWALNEFSQVTDRAAAPVAAVRGNQSVPRGEAAGAQTEPAEAARLVTQGQSEIVVPPGPRGHFFLVAEVNGVDVQFLVDTGASTVTLTEEDARRVGLSPYSLDYSATYKTANGDIAAAPVTLQRIQLRDLELSDVEATVTRAPLSISLMGMSFLSRLPGYEVRSDGLVLRY
jgi:aspartyl protease family protein